MITLQCITKIIADVFTTHILSTSKTIATVVQVFGCEKNFVKTYGKLHRVCVWECISLKSSVSSSWYESQKSKDKKTGVQNSPTGAGNLLANISGGSPALQSMGDGDVVDQKDFRVKNTQILKSLVTQLPNLISATMQCMSRFKLFLII